MCNERLDSYRSFNLDEKELESKINNCLKSHKELGELIDYQYPSLDTADKEKNAIKLYQTKIIYPSCVRIYDGINYAHIGYDSNIGYDLTKLKDYTFVEKATSIIIKVPRKEIK